jgi:hypothetical protein
VHNAAAILNPITFVIFILLRKLIIRKNYIQKNVNYSLKEIFYFVNICYYY